MDNQPNNPLHGVKLADIVEHLVDTFGWEELGAKININCFNSNPSVKSSLKFLRKTPWAREKVERLYLQSIGKRMPRKKPAIEPPAKLENEKSDASPGESPWDAARKTRESRGK
jgi:uncharacterized protein (DUF2132 family)